MLRSSSGDRSTDATDSLRRIAAQADALRVRLDAMARDIAAVEGIIDELDSALEAARYPTTEAPLVQETSCEVSDQPKDQA